jgi:hypothetical protein
VVLDIGGAEVGLHEGVDGDKDLTGVGVDKDISAFLLLKELVVQLGMFHKERTESLTNIRDTPMSALSS